MAIRIENITSVVLIFLILFIKVGSTLDSNCCANTSRYDLDKKVCINSSGKSTDVLLKCNRYLLDPQENEKDKFYWNNNGPLIVGEEEEDQQTVNNGEYVDIFFTNF